MHHGRKYVHTCCQSILALPCHDAATVHDRWSTHKYSGVLYCLILNKYNIYIYMNIISYDFYITSNICKSLYIIYTKISTGSLQLGPNGLLPRFKRFRVESRPNCGRSSIGCPMDEFKRNAAKACVLWQHGRIKRGWRLREKPHSGEGQSDSEAIARGSEKRKRQWHQPLQLLFCR